LAGVQFYVNGIGTGGKGGIPKGLAKTYWPAFGPRIGFAYDLTGQGKTVIRGGFGINYDRIQGNDLYNGATNPPNDASPTLHGVSLSDPGTSVQNNNARITPQICQSLHWASPEWPWITNPQRAISTAWVCSKHSATDLSWVSRMSAIKAVI